jgi:ACS family hexuronate transporter-like MFS transporter
LGALIVITGIGRIVKSALDLSETAGRVLSVTLTLTLGIDMALVLRTAAVEGRQQAFRAALGINAGCLLWGAAVAFGLGALLAGWASTRLLEAGWNPNRVRKSVMLVCAQIVLPLPLVLSLKSFWPVAVMIGVVMAGHQGFSLSLVSTITDVVPGAKVGRVTAFGAFMGNMGGVAISLVTGRVLDAGFGFVPLFVFAAASYLVALAWFQWLLPEIRRPVEDAGLFD